KKNARLIVSKIILETFLSLNMSYPETGKERRQELLKIRELLVQEGKIDGL
ncbi:MAG: polyphosphate kinase 2 family protein, partial [Chlorobium phaeobacteroides]|nr:polyphosphate kinase 2 family protein [Chlorobium phaeobacteroides]